MRKIIQSNYINQKFDFAHFLCILIVAIAGILILAGFSLAADQKPQLQTELPQPDIPQPQFFCGYCHILTYPGVVQKGYDLWKKGKHNGVGCVECHYPPKEAKATKSAPTATTDAVVKASHIPKNPPERFSYLKLGGQTVMTRPRVSDANCMTSNCHGKPDDKFKTKKIKFTEKVSFVHEPHLDKKKQIEGQQVNCTSCHQHETDKKKFEVTKASCHLCHFTNVKFNQDRGKCDLCHELPTKPIQTSGEKPITHEMLKKANVSCSSCHFDVIQAAGGSKYEAYFEKGVLKTAMVLGASYIKKENCLACHDQDKILKEDRNKKLMHQKHVTIKNARCFDCHQPITHTKADLNPPVLKGTTTSDSNQTLSAQIVRDSCAVCHPDPHRYQRLLAEGEKRKGVTASPDPMYKARTNCLGCHIEKKFTKKGQRLMMASAATCVQCHTKDHKKMLKDWKDELVKEIDFAKEVENEALAAFTKSKSELSKSKLATARKLLSEGRRNLNIVKFGNGVHNKKYSIMLIDAAINSFEDMVDFLEENQ